MKKPSQKKPDDTVMWVFAFFIIFCLLFAYHQLTSPGYNEPDYFEQLTDKKFWEGR